MSILSVRRILLWSIVDLSFCKEKFCIISVWNIYSADTYQYYKSTEAYKIISHVITFLLRCTNALLKPVQYLTILGYWCIL